MKRIRSQKKAAEISMFLQNTKTEKGCERCGYNKCARALHYHHLDPTSKTRAVGLIRRTWSKLHNEISKCQLLCSNCHYEIEDQKDHGTHQNQYTKPPKMIVQQTFEIF